MSTQAVVTLHTLRCITESDRAGSSHSEPYIWPFMASVSANSFETTPTAALLAESRRIRKNEMQAGQSVGMDFPGNTVAATFRDDQPDDRQLILIVALLEADDAPTGAIQTGYQAFLDELKLRLGHKIIALKTATQDEKDAIIAEIQRQVSARVTSAISGALTAGQKVKVLLGWLNMDDQLGSAVKHFTDLTPQDFTLHFSGTSGDPLVSENTVVVFPVEYEIDGRLNVNQIVADPCQDNVDAVAAAEAKIHGLHLQVQTLQQQLHTATPQQKPGIIASIKNINEVRIPEAEQALAGAQRMLQRCRVMGPLHGDLDNPILG